MKNRVRILTTAIIMVALLSGAILPSTSIFADAPSASYLMSPSPFTIGERISMLCVVWDSNYEIFRMTMGGGTPAVWGLNEENNIDCGIYESSEEGGGVGGNLTVYYEHGQKSAIDAIASGAPFNASCVTYEESLFTVSGGVYTYTGNPEGWTITINEETPFTDPPTLTPYITEPSSGHRSICRMPMTTYSEEDTVSSAFWTANDAEGEEEPNCPVWKSVWDSAPIIPASPFLYVGTTDISGGAMIFRAVIPFNTSDIPDDAIITGAYLRCPLLMWVTMIEGEEDPVELEQHFILQGASNLSFLPFHSAGGELLYNASDFYGNFGEFTTFDFPIGAGEGGEGYFTPEIYWDTVLNDDGLDAINVTGLTGLAMRAEDDANYECPTISGYFLFFSAAMGWEDFVATYPESYLVVDWYSPSEGGEPIIPTGPVSAVLIILGLVFTVLGLLGIMAVLFKGESLAVSFKIGVLLGLSIFAIIGIVIIESIIVAMT